MYKMSVNLVHFLFLSRMMPLCGLIPPQLSCNQFFLDLKRWVRVLFVLHLKSVKSENGVCMNSVHLWSHWSVEQEHCSSLGWGFTFKIILVCHYNDNCVDAFTSGFTYMKKSFWFFRDGCVQNFTPALDLSGASICLWNIGRVLMQLTTGPLCSPQNIQSTALYQPLLKT